jgi:hypothetical protein
MCTPVAMFSKLVKSVLKLYFEAFVDSSNCFTFHFTKFLSHFLNKLMLNRNYFFNSKSGEKLSHHFVHIL